MPGVTYQKQGKIVHPQLYLEVVLPGGGYIELQMHRVQEADDVGNGYAYTKTCYGACICA